jgi:hypothetical protein
MDRIKDIFVCPSCDCEFDRESGFQYHLEHSNCSNTWDIDKFHCSCEHDFTTTSEFKHHIETRFNSTSPLGEKHPKIPHKYPHLINFGEENIEDIIKVYPDLFDDAISNHQNIIPYLIQKINCDQKVFPQYCNIYVIHKHSQYARICKDSYFWLRTKKKTILDIIKNYRDILGQYCERKCDSTLSEKYIKYFETIDNDSTYRRNLGNEILDLLTKQCENFGSERDSGYQSSTKTQLFNMYS